MLKLGEALTLRARQGQQLNELRQRIIANALVQQDQQPVENADILIGEYLKLSDQHAKLVRRINETNAESGLLEKLTEREHLGRMRSVYEGAATAATPARDSYRWMRTEVAFTPAIDVGACRNAAEMYGEMLRKLDVEIQAINWSLDLK